MSDKVDFSEIQTLANILNKMHLQVCISANLTIYEHFTRDEVEDIEVLHQENYTVQEISDIYGTDTIKIKRVIRLINNNRRKGKRK